ncbi:MAG: PIN domain-containing protein [Chthoniobacterales bacterium]
MVSFRPICCDTSFLFSLYGRDAFTVRAAAQVAELKQVLTLSTFNEFELWNSIRFAVCRGFLSADRGTRMLTQLATDRSAGGFHIPQLDLPDVLAEARRLSAIHTLTGGHRAFDILHVAAAVRLNAGLFLSFDENQCGLARSVGLTLAPD